VKVSAVETHVVSVPYRKPEAWRFGRAWGLTNVIVKVRTDDGLVGVGEAPGNPAVAVIRSAIVAIGDLIVGEHALDVAALARLVRQRGWHHYPYVGNQAAGAIEMALWDIAGQAHGAPVHRFFGGLQRPAVPFYWHIPAERRDPAEAAEQAQEGVERGFGTLYLKVGFDLHDDVSLVRAIREQVGDSVAIRVDANEAWTVREAAAALAAFEELGLEFLEQPIDMHDIEGLALLRRRSATAIGANQSAWLEQRVLDILRLQAADVVVTDLHQLGGLLAFARVAGMCETARTPVVKHSFGDLGITTVASMHQLAGLPEPCLAHQTHLELVEHDLLTERLTFVDGALAVPTGAGLGIELDEEALAHYEQLYERIGEFSGYAPLDGGSPLEATEATT
jgi:L-alanine-DL-glutamate epimerase-like enolase superfamily enzyme